MSLTVYYQRAKLHVMTMLFFSNSFQLVWNLEKTHLRYQLESQLKLSKRGPLFQTSNYWHLNYPSKLLALQDHSFNLQPSGLLNYIREWHE